MEDIKVQLEAPFKETDIEWRIGRSGKNTKGFWAMCLAYVSNRAIQQRLDDVFGVMGWKNEYKEWHNDSQLCGISVYDEDKKEWITKWDGADNTDFESTKGGLSDSMKRAAVHWGIGRYLYKLEEGFAEIQASKQKGFRYAKYKSESFYWRPPALPSWAVDGKPTKREPIKTEEKVIDRTDWTDLASNYKTVEELGKWFKSLSKDEQKLASGVVGNRKQELIDSGEIPF